MGSNAEPQGPDFPTIIKNRTDPETGDILGVVLTVFDKTGMSSAHTPRNFLD